MALWLGSQNAAKPDLWSFAPERLFSSGGAPSGSIRPAVPVVGRTVAGCEFDPAGNLWCWTIGGTSASTQYLMMFRPATLRRGSIAPDITISLAGTSGISRMRFVGVDAWIQTLDNFHVWKISQAQLAAGGAVTPPVQLTFAAGTASGSGVDLVFDAAANMFAVYYGIGGGFGESSIAKVIPANYASTSASLTPDRLIGGNASGNVRGYSGSTLDPDGTSVWVVSYDNDAAYKFTGAQLNTTAADPAPTVTLTSAAFNGPQGCAFKASDLWVSNWDDGKLLRIPAAQLLASGAVTPDVTITTGVVNAAYFAFAP